jgi:hypothetical protein
MPVVVATNMKVRQWRDLPAFLRASIAVARQATRTTGFLAGRMRIDANGRFWTLTAWESDRAMAGFRDSGVHVKVTPRLVDWASDAQLGVWNAEAPELPPWAVTAEQVNAQGNFTTLKAPSHAHRQRQPIMAHRCGLEVDLKPRRLLYLG